jgi:cysteine desulfurase
MLRPLILGGGQQHGLRSGTIPTFLAIGLAEAIRISNLEMVTETERLKKLSNFLLQELSGCVKFSMNGCIKHRLPNNLNLRFEKPAIELLAELPMLAMSTGSACLSNNGSTEPSYVLKAIGLSDEEIRKSVRLSVGRFTTEEDIKNAAAQLIEVLRVSKPL